VIEASGVFVGTIVGATEEATTGQKKITVKSDTGETKIFPFAETVKIVDNTFNAVTFNQLKAGDKVSVEYTKEGNTEKAKTVTVTK
jgi:3-dehydroquinate synthase class II